MSDKGSTIVKSSIGVLGLLQVAFIILTQGNRMVLVLGIHPTVD